MAEPNVTIISASIPVLRGFTRGMRTKDSSAAAASGPYVRTGNSSAAYGHSGRGPRHEELDDLDGSDTSILGQSTNTKVDSTVALQNGVMVTTDVNVESVEMERMR